MDCAYVTKYLWREDLVPAKSILEHNLKQEYLRRMLEWWIEIEHGWSVKPGAYGRELKRWLDPGLWAELQATYAGGGYEQNFRGHVPDERFIPQGSRRGGKLFGIYLSFRPGPAGERLPESGQGFVEARYFFQSWQSEMLR